MPKFWRRGVSLLDFLPAIAAGDLTPTALEITAGEPVTPAVADINGWEFQNNAIPIPNLQDTFTGSIPGEDTVADSSITLYDDDTDDTLRALFAKGTNGFLLWRPYGAGAGKRAEVFPIRVANITDQKSMGNDPARFVVNCSITAEPNVDVALP